MDTPITQFIHDVKWNRKILNAYWYALICYAVITLINILVITPIIYPEDQDWLM
jgi:hypothetical protein